ncbi:MAG: tRNA (N(6)-L-threonylcarbamoyladenosine(37)-C(2))-methylthiotransferase MtaB [Candidatus Sabulitectum sp.]|nr:tRNA (N(6)-L-threonylcarbamoyladenosine(37)-C(2))-methylthiotransferase MtaB [Candidatus Sabulitectum sp.]
MNLPEKTAVFGYTLGCRLNSYETEALVGELVDKLSGIRVNSPQDADLILVNTCAVTGRSQARSRKTVRAYTARYPDATIVVTGCVAVVSPDDYNGMDKVTVVPNDKKHLIASMISGVQEASSDEYLYPVFAPVKTSKTRAFLKIQDGCSNRCTYCIVPLARGDSRSQPRELVLSQAKEMAEAGYSEICLTGVDIADYGRGLYTNGYGLPELVEELLGIGGFRLRIGSVEPQYLTVKTLENLVIPGLCRHFHIPFQSGSDRILKRMGRRYSRTEEGELLDAVASLFPGACIGSDIIAGFPGESEEDYQQSLDIANDSRINYLHVFPFSPRPGTPAAEMKPLHTEMITMRSEELRRVSTSSRREFRKNNLFTKQTMLVESRTINGRMIGLTDNYIPVYAPEMAKEGELTDVRLTEENICWGQR